MTEWSPLDDIGRSQAAMRHHTRRAAEAMNRVLEAKAATLANMDRLLALLGDGSVDWTDATDEECAQMADAIDTIQRVREIVASAPCGRGEDAEG